MIRVADKDAFYTQVLAERSATWLIAKGIWFVSCREHRHWGMALHVESQALSPEQLKQALVRRFREVDRYDQYFLFFDTRQDFVIWHALPDSPKERISLDPIRNAQLTLAGLEHLLEQE
jgi:hypothetical protein